MRFYQSVITIITQIRPWQTAIVLTLYGKLCNEAIGSLKNLIQAESRVEALDIA